MDFSVIVTKRGELESVIQRRDEILRAPEAEKAQALLELRRALDDAAGECVDVLGEKDARELAMTIDAIIVARKALLGTIK